MRGLRQSLWLAAWAVPGAILGTLVAVRISDTWFQIAVGIVNILTIVTMFLPKSKAAEGDGDDRKRKILVGITLFFVGIYGGFIQLSVGFLLMATLYRLSRMNLVLVNMHKVTIALVYNLPALAIFWWTDNVRLLPGLILGLGSAVGGWTSAKIQIRKGEEFIKIVLAIALVLISLKLFGAF